MPSQCLKLEEATDTPGCRSDIVSDVVPSHFRAGMAGEADAFFAGRVATLSRFCGVFVVVVRRCFRDGGAFVVFFCGVVVFLVWSCGGVFVLVWWLCFCNGAVV